MRHARGRHVLMCPAVARVTLVLALGAGGDVLAQNPESAGRSRNFGGLFAGAAVSSTWVSFGDDDASGRWAVRLDFGYRFRELCLPWLPVLCWQRVTALAPLRLTGGVTLVATDLRGMDPVRDRYAYANVDLALRASYTVQWGRELRPYVEMRRGTRTAELVSPTGSETWNYSGPGTAIGAGLELPITPTGRGLDLGIVSSRGRFSQYEYLGDPTGVDLPHRALIVHLGWSGPFSGISLPWQ